MNGLLDFLSTDEGRMGLGLLAAAGPRSDGMNTGGRIQLAMQGMDARKQEGLKAKLLEMQMKNYESEIDARKLAGVKDARQQANLDRFMNGDDNSGAISPGAFSPSRDGNGPVMPMNAPQATQGGIQGGAIAYARSIGIPDKAIQADMTFNGGKGIADMMFKRGTPDMQVTNGYAWDKNKQGAGFMPSFTTTSTGQGIINQIGANGLPMSSIPQGALESFGAYKDTEAGKKPMKVHNPVTGRDEWVTEKDVVDAARPPARSAPPMLSVPASAGAPAGYRTEPQMKTTAGGDIGGARSQVIAQIAANKKALMQPIDENSKALLRQDIALNERKLADPLYAESVQKANAGDRLGNFAAGPSTAETLSAKVAEEKALGQVKADITSTDAKIAKYESAFDAVKVINKTLAHPGLSTATGLQGKIDPRNYIAGTDAKDFEVMRKQLKGTAFMTAYVGLKGGGAISEKEGEKAEDALARLDKAQSTLAFNEALNDYKEILERGLKSASTGLEKNGIKPFNEPAKPQAPKASFTQFGYQNEAAAIKEAQNAIMRGASRDAVQKRLESMGLSLPNIAQGRL